MNRRSALLTFALAVPWPLRAHHGWSTFDTARPLYLEGVVSTVTWADPHAQLELQLNPSPELPPDLTRRTLPPQQDPIDLKAVLAKVALPVPGDRQWRVFLPSLARLASWDVRRPKVGDAIAVVGYPGPVELGDPAARAEILFIGERAYPLRSDPASPRRPGT